MEPEFWLERWEKREIGFHQAETNRFLEQYWSTLELAKDSSVFVPLCGKSKDMRWLAQQGYRVLGIEVCETAVQEFFEEWDVQPARTHKGPFVCYSAKNIEILVGDFFALTAEDLKVVAGVYDRASLVALPPDMRCNYVNVLAELLPAKTQTLLISFEYSLNARKGPPFSIDKDAVQRLFAEKCHINLLDSQPFDLRGVAAIEHAFQLVYH